MEAHCHLQTTKGGAVVGDIVIVHDNKHPHGLWKLGSTEKLLPGADGDERVHLSRYNRTDTLTSSRDNFNEFILWKSDRQRKQVRLLTWVIICPNLTRFQVHQGQMILPDHHSRRTWGQDDRNACWYFFKVLFLLFSTVSTTQQGSVWGIIHWFVVMWEALDRPHAKIAKAQSELCLNLNSASFLFLLFCIARICCKNCH